MDIAKLRKLSFLALVILAAAWGVTSWLAERLPPGPILSELQEEPEQTPLTGENKPFTVQRNGQNYHITPKFKYRLRGLVVTRSDSSSWFNITHEKAADFINIGDLCVVWGANAHHPYFSKLNFRSGDWTCYVQTGDSRAWQAFKINQLSNNHVLPETEAIAELIMKARIGDQIEFSGELVDYSINENTFVRKSSTTRDDTGGTACEVVFVRDFRILKKAHTTWRSLEALMKLGTIASLFTLLVSLFVLPFVIKD